MKKASLCIYYIREVFFMPKKAFCQMLGFLMFWMGVGILFALFLNNKFVMILIGAIFLLVGYYLYCSS